MESYESRLADAKAKAHAEGKEPFDFAKFAGVYPHDTGSCERLRPDEPACVQEQYVLEYYLDYPEIRTVEEFAEFLDRIDESY